MSAAKLTEELHELLNVVAEAVAEDPAAASQVGTRLVEIHCVGGDSLRRSIEVLARFVVQEGADAQRAALVIGAVSAAYTEAIQAFVLEQQESISQALLRANRAVQLDLQASEERFEDIFARSSTGIAMVSLDGALERANEALCTILRREDVAGMTLTDLIAPADLPLITDALASLRYGRMRRIEERPRLIDRDGEHFRVLLAATVQRDAEDNPGTTW